MVVSQGEVRVGKDGPPTGVDDIGLGSKGSDQNSKGRHCPDKGDDPDANSGYATTEELTTRVVVSDFRSLTSLTAWASSYGAQRMARSLRRL